nr:PREDICTED: vitellogenin-2-like [Anolis carolinensis]|eukprot:XP_016850381.1 PREDICTED: vitellogenin-2-like [Anolis carolinensis]
MQEYVGFPIEPRDQFAEPKDQFVEPPKQDNRLAACDLHNYRAVYRNGQFGEIRVAKEAPRECVNHMRAVMNLFIANIKDQNEFQLKEDGIAGECLTRYFITDDRNKCPMITKTKDYSNCDNKVQRTIGMSYFHLYPKCPLKNTMVQGTAAFVMKLKCDGPVSMISEVESEEVYQIAPFSEASGAGVMRTR